MKNIKNFNTEVGKETMIIGILALQGGYALHQEKFTSLGIETLRVLHPQQLQNLAGLVIPGGESSTMLKLGIEGLWSEIKNFSTSRPVWGVCAGSVLMATKVQNPQQRCLRIIDITIRRNAYGSQKNSFIKKFKFNFMDPFESECLFIRAPKIITMGKSVKSLATLDSTPVMVEQGKHLVTTFHPELGNNVEFHRFFLKKCQK